MFFWWEVESVDFPLSHSTAIHFVCKNAPFQQLLKPQRDGLQQMKLYETWYSKREILNLPRSFISKQYLQCVSNPRILKAKVHKFSAITTVPYTRLHITSPSSLLLSHPFSHSHHLSSLAYPALSSHAHTQNNHDTTSPISSPRSPQSDPGKASKGAWRGYIGWSCP